MTEAASKTTSTPREPVREHDGQEFRAAPVEAGRGDDEAPRDLSAQKLFRGLSHLHSLVIVCDVERRLVWSSAALGEQPWARRVLPGCDVLELLPPDATALASELRALHADALLASGPVGRRILFPGPGDAPSPVDVRMFKANVGAQGETWLVAILRDAEDGAAGCRATSSQRSSEQPLAALLDNAPDGVVAVDAQGFITYANEAAARLAGRDRASVRDQPISAFVAGAEDWGRLVAELREGGRVDDLDMELVRSDGQRLWLSVSSQAIQGMGEAGSVIFLRDVSERRRVEQMLARKNAELEAYVHTVSHDLRSPLVSLLGFTRLLRQDYEASLDDTGRHFVERIEQAGRTMESLIEDLLELSGIGRPGEYRALIDPRQVLVQIQAELKPRLDARGIELLLPTAPPMVLSDRTRLYQIFSNLIGNALMHAHGETPPCNARIEVSIEADGEDAHLCVADNGRGIDPQHHDRIFEVFQSLGPSRGASSSTGIGLAIVQKIVESYRGRIWLESSLGQGAAFHLTLPGR